MSKKHYEKEFTIKGVNLKLKRLGLTEFPSFKTVYARSIDAKDIEGMNKAHQMLFSWVEYEMVPGEWIPAYSTKEDRFVVDVLNDVIVADQIINTILSDILMPLFLNTAE